MFVWVGVGVGMEKFPGLEYTSAYYRAVDMVIDHGGPETTSTVCGSPIPNPMPPPPPF